MRSSRMKIHEFDAMNKKDIFGGLLRTDAERYGIYWMGG